LRIGDAKGLERGSFFEKMRNNFSGGEKDGRRMGRRGNFDHFFRIF
jgi:hypothetical protein